LPKNVLDKVYMKPGITNADTVVTRRQVLITLFQGLSRVLLIDII